MSVWLMWKALEKKNINCRFGFREPMDFLLDLSRLTLALPLRFKSIKCCWQPSFFNATTLLFIKFNEFIWIREGERERERVENGQYQQEREGVARGEAKVKADDLRTTILKGLKLKQVYGLIDSQGEAFALRSSPASATFRQLSTLNLQLGCCLLLLPATPCCPLLPPASCCHATNSIRFANFGSISWQAALFVVQCAILFIAHCRRPTRERESTQHFRNLISRESSSEAQWDLFESLRKSTEIWNLF